MDAVSGIYCGIHSRERRKMYAKDISEPFHAGMESL